MIIALLISGLKQRGIEFSPYSIKRAIRATSSKLDYIDVYAQGSGLLNVEKAFEHLVQYQNSIENMVGWVERILNIMILLTLSKCIVL